MASGERVLDVQPKLGARVRLLDAGDTNKNDPNDARSVAVAALRSPGAQVRAEDHAAVLKVWSKRHRDLGRIRTQAACRLHAVLCQLLPGGVSRHITAGQAARILGTLTPPDAVAAARRPKHTPGTCVASMPGCGRPGRSWLPPSGHPAPA
ncbi:MAG TPA: transposase [Trebonia sp.]